MNKKVCRICGKEKSVTQFSKDRTKKDGHDNKCKECHAFYKAQWQRDNPDKLKQYQIKCRQKNRPPGYVFHCYLRQGRAALNKIRKQERKAEREREEATWQSRINAKTKKCIQCGEVKLKKEFDIAYGRSIDGHRNHCKACRKEYFKSINNWKNKRARHQRLKGWGWHGSERARIIQRANSQKRLERKRKIEPIINNQTFKDLKERFNNKCFKCGSKEGLSFDHHYPLSIGFGLSDINAVLLCRSCNSSKGNRPPEIFYTKQELNKLKRLHSIGYGARNRDARGGQAVLFP